MNTKYKIPDTRYKLRYKPGFALAELIVVVGVVAVIASMGAISLYNTNRDLTVLNDQAQIIAQQLSNASAKAKSQEGGYQWWMRFDNPTGGANDIMYLCYGTSYTANNTSCATEGVGSAESQRYTLSNIVQFTDPASGASKNIVFAKATGLPTNTVSVVITLVSGLASRTVTMNTNGRIDIQASNLPSIDFQTVTNITSTGATLGANITSDGGAAITARGTCWGTTTAPISNCLPDGGTTTGVFTQARTGMSASTLYYYRGYVTNSVGTIYSSDGSFTTTLDGACGSANGVPVTSAPSTNLCSAGTASAVSGTGPWTWSCNGANGGTNASCSAPVATPNAPTIGTATDTPSSRPYNNGLSTVTFTPSASGPAATSFTVTSSPGGFTGTGASSPITVSSLTTGTAYTFTVTASNANGTSPASAASNSITATTVPQAPTIGVAAVSSTTYNYPPATANYSTAYYPYPASSTSCTYSCNAGDSLSGTTCTHTSTYAATPTTFWYSCNNDPWASAPKPCEDGGGVWTSGNPYFYSGPPYSCPSGGTLSGTTCTVTSTYAAASSCTTTYCTSGGSWNGSNCGTYTYISSYTCNSGGIYQGTGTAVGSCGTYTVSTTTVTYTNNATGGSAITGNTATSSPGGITGTGTSPITVSGLTTGTAYTFTVTASNANGTSAASAASNSVTP